MKTINFDQTGNNRKINFKGYGNLKTAPLRVKANNKNLTFISIFNSKKEAQKLVNIRKKLNIFFHKIVKKGSYYLVYSGRK